MILSYNIDFAATTGGLIWLMYSWALIIKVIILYYFISLGKLGANDYPLLSTNSIYVCLYITPLLYVILSFRSTVQLYGTNQHTISLMSMLHIDMIVHVMFDLVDLMSAFGYASLPQSLVGEEFSFVMSTILALGLFAHSYSFPTSSGSDDARDPGHQGDVFLARKHSALVGIFIFDIPLLCLRLYLWLTYPSVPGFDPFLIKNITFLPLQAFRLNQCQLAQREALRTKQRNLMLGETSEEIEPPQEPEQEEEQQEEEQQPVVTLTPPIDPVTLVHPSSTAAPLAFHGVLPASVGRQRQRTESTELLEAASKVHSSFIDEYAVSKKQRGLSMTYNPRALLSPDDTRTQRMSFDWAGPSDDRRPRHDTPSSVRSGKENSLEAEGGVSGGEDELNIYELDTDRRERQERQRAHEASRPNILNNFLADVTSVRKLPIRGFKFSKVLKKTIQAMRLMSLHGLSCMLDETLIIGYWKQLRFAFPMFIAWGSQAALLALGVSYNSVLYDGPFKLSKAKHFHNLPPDMRISFYLAGLGGFAMLFTWVGSAPFLDVLFVSFFWSLRLTSWYATFQIIRDSAPPEFQFNFVVLIILFGAKPVFSLLQSLFNLHSAFLGRVYMFFVVKGAHRNIRKHNATLENPSQKDRGDESGWVTTSSVLVFNSVRNCYAPITFGELLIGPDLIKDIRLMDHLVLRSWLELMFIIVLKILTVGLCPDWMYAFIFFVHILFAFIYIIFSQAVRLLALKRMEAKAMFDHILQVCMKKDTVQEDGSLAAAATAGTDNNIASEYNAIINKFRKQQFFTSPGDLFPLAM